MYTSETDFQIESPKSPAISPISSICFTNPGLASFEETMPPLMETA